MKYGVVCTLGFDQEAKTYDRALVKVLTFLQQLTKMTIQEINDKFVIEITELKEVIT